ncbi:hypothetical protein EES45_05820 [Streptomyces sp. ADI97-07]|uniref:Uncharacterized protein n=1 Tax=Streptomyces clavifer TaxID=68188 RepID=A0ABS4V2F3_9ACTN|nr:hypothetical protein [Streptomyces clavifer]RPK83818.1 hypothetical protein EES45_05820 [Streptomyces sp. ADI97-07]GHA88491.1 hypothetical protein GCM10010392_13610 [Streptomyces clavifer]
MPRRVGARQQAGREGARDTVGARPLRPGSPLLPGKAPFDASRPPTPRARIPVHPVTRRRSHDVAGAVIAADPIRA